MFQQHSGIGQSWPHTDNHRYVSGSPRSHGARNGFRATGRQLGRSVFQQRRINRDEIVEQLASAEAEIAVSVNWLTIVGQRVCDLFPHGVINGHAGDLPRYRGNAPWAYAILNGESQMGICIHQMDPGES